MFNYNDTLKLHINLLEYQFLKYDSLPMYLAFLYLFIEKGNTIYYKYGENSVIKITSLSENKNPNFFCNEIFVIDDFGNEYETDLSYLTKILKGLKIKKNRKGKKYTHISNQLNIHSKFSLFKKYKGTEEYVFMRNTYMIHCLRSLAFYASKNYQCIPHILIYPFLFLNKKSELLLPESRKDSNLYSLKFDHNKKSIKSSAKGSLRAISYEVSEAASIYGIQDDIMKKFDLYNLSNNYSINLLEDDL